MLGARWGATDENDGGDRDMEWHVAHAEICHNREELSGEAHFRGRRPVPPLASDLIVKSA